MEVVIKLNSPVTSLTVVVFVWSQFRFQFGLLGIYVFVCVGFI